MRGPSGVAGARREDGVAGMAVSWKERVRAEGRAAARVDLVRGRRGGGAVVVLVVVVGARAVIVSSLVGGGVGLVQDEVGSGPLLGG